jgi:primosomal protein DnaI
MNSLSDETAKYQKKDLDYSLKSAYATSLKDSDFKKLLNTLKVKDDIAYKYTSKLERTVEELHNCANCKSLVVCQNKVSGMVYYPKLENDKLTFNYVACKYKKKFIRESEEIKSKFYEMPYDIKTAKMSEIEVDKGRANIIKWLKKFYDNYKKDRNQKGLYLHGSFGSGKTYMLSALLNELSKDGFSAIVVYYPELLRSLKESFNNEDYPARIEEIKRCDLLLIDDIGAETTSSWNRDEILGTILQHRMDNKKSTFFTSNLTLEELENHFILSNKAEEKIKSRRIMERIKQLTEDLELIGESKRK